MAGIPYDEETSRDWDWFAVDPDGYVGHFTTATFRLLPRSVRDNSARTEALIQLVEELPEICAAEVRPPFWSSQKVLGQNSVVRAPQSSERYFRSFVLMARKGLFSYDTELKHVGDYLGVTVPAKPILIEALPEGVRSELIATRASVCFRDAFRISECETLNW